VQWGIVPVEKDGSANFKVPADRSLFFQALDKDFREIQRERTVVNYKAGQIRACVGCHGKSSIAPAMGGAFTGKPPIAVKRPPSELMVQPCDMIENGGDGRPQQVIHYTTDIQPIFDAKCISCHGNKNPKADLTLTGDMKGIYSNSYVQITSKELAGPLISEFTSFTKGEQANYNGTELPAKSLGSHKSIMIDMLTNPKHPKNAKKDHSKRLTKMELMRMIRWADSNYQFYGSYYGRQHPIWQNADEKNPAYDPADFRRKATFEEAISNRAPKWHR
jgi:cytochrome c553